MRNDAIFFTPAKKIFTRKELGLVDDFQHIKSLAFASEHIEKSVRKRVLCLSKSYKKSWLDYLLHRRNLDGCLESLEIEFINPLVGFGVFATSNIAKYSFIGEYVGLVRRRKFFMNSDNDYVFGYSIAGSHHRFVVDAQDMGNITRFINHSYEPNLFCSTWFEDGLSHVGFFSKKTIKRGEQLTFDYGLTYWKRRPYPQTL